MECTLRSLVTLADRDAIEQITRSSGFFSEQEVGIALEVFDDAALKCDSGYRCVVAEQEGVKCGYAIWGLDEQSVCSYELYWIAVMQEQRGYHIGSTLLGFVEDAIQEAGGGQLFVETSGREQYAATRTFYERRGYRIAAWLDDYFAPGDARVIYAKRI